MRRFFWYGTLRPDITANVLDVIAPGSKMLGLATISGKLYNLGPYPGVKLSTDEDDRVVGVVVEVEDAMVQRLDLYEGVPHHYRRVEKVKALLENGDVTPVDVYEYNNDVEHIPVIANGDWRDVMGVEASL